jgi:putative lysine transport system substrate-binding protein
MRTRHFGNARRAALLIASTVVLLAAVLSGCSGGQRDTELRVGLECAYAPFNWTQVDISNGAVAIGDGTYAGGFDVEIAKRLADGLGRKLVIEKTDWEGLLPALTSGKIDAIIAGMSPTAERKESIDFSNNYYTSDLVIVVKKDGAYAQATSLQGFSGAKITGQLNTFHDTVIEQIPGVQKQTAMEDFPTMIAALTSGKIDGYVSERPGAISAQVSNPDLTYVAFDEGNGFVYDADDVAIAVGLKKGSNLTPEINKILAGISEADRQVIMENAVKNQPAAE